MKLLIIYIFCTLLNASLVLAVDSSNDTLDYQEIKTFGKMYMPYQIKELIKMQLFASDIKNADWENLKGIPLGGVVRSYIQYGGCSGFFVSDNGLMMTNYHCAEEVAQSFKKGFYASTLDKEFKVKESAAYETVLLEDITDKIIINNNINKDEIEKNEDQVSREYKCTVDCAIFSVQNGVKYFIVKWNALTDIRLVYAPDGFGSRKVTHNSGPKVTHLLLIKYPIHKDHIPWQYF